MSAPHLSRRRLLAVPFAAAVARPTLSYAAANHIGLSLPLTGVQAEVAKEIKAGYEIALSASGSALRLKVLDDESNPQRTAENIKALAADSSILTCSGIVGTPHAQLALPVATSAGLPVVGIRSGAQSLRTGQAGVFHLRAGFNEELDKVVTMCKGAGFQSMAILYSNDAFGTSSKDHLTNRLKEAGIGIAVSSAVDRNGENLEQVTAQLADSIKASGAVIGIALLLIAKPMQTAASLLREKHRIVSPLFAMSFVATRAIATAPTPSLAGLGLVTAFPLPRTATARPSSQFRADALRSKVEPLIESLAAYEGYFYGSVIAQSYAQGGLTRESLMKRLSANILVGDTSIEFDKNKVGYKYLEIVRKSTSDGKLRA